MKCHKNSLLSWVVLCSVIAAVIGLYYRNQVTQTQYNRALAREVINGNVIAVHQMLQRGADPNMRRKHRAADTSLWAVCVQALNRLFVRHALEDTDGNTVLAIATRAGRDDIVGVLLEHGANPNIVGSDEDDPEYVAIRGPLGNAVLFGYPRITSLLLKHGADPDVRDRTGMTPLIMAGLLYGEIDSDQNYRRHLNTGLALQSHPLPYPQAFLLGWCRREDSSAEHARFVGLHGDVDAFYKSLCRDYIRLLLEYHANADVKDAAGKSVVDYARASRSRELLELLQHPSPANKPRAERKT